MNSRGERRGTLETKQDTNIEELVFGEGEIVEDVALGDMGE